MPMIRVELFEGRSPEIKKELIKALTLETARVAGVSEASVDVIITEIKKENWGIAGEPASVKYPD
ncbi:MAG: 2-hydroxymuconate tautomerase family protein [Sneathiella sp.]